MTQEQSFTAGEPGETRTPSNTSSHSSKDNLAVRVSDPGSANGDLMGRPGSLQVRALQAPLQAALLFWIELPQHPPLQQATPFRCMAA